MHVAISMDGNGRWDPRRGSAGIGGPAEGAAAVCAAVEAAARLGVRTLTLYAGCSAAWARSPAERVAVLDLIELYLLTQTFHCVEQSIRISVIGRREVLCEQLRSLVERSERLSGAGFRLHVRIVIDYSSHDAIMQAIWRKDRNVNITPENFYRRICAVDATALAAGAVDLLIRTGVETRLSDFMLWEVAYAELYFTDSLWPHFDAQALQLAFDYYAGRRSNLDAFMPGHTSNRPVNAGCRIQARRPALKSGSPLVH